MTDRKNIDIILALIILAGIIILLRRRYSLASNYTAVNGGVSPTYGAGIPKLTPIVPMTPSVSPAPAPAPADGGGGGMGGGMHPHPHHKKDKQEIVIYQGGYGYPLYPLYDPLLTLDLAKCYCGEDRRGREITCRGYYDVLGRKVCDCCN
jgi:hypothetical protein